MSLPSVFSFLRCSLLNLVFFYNLYSFAMINYVAIVNILPFGLQPSLEVNVLFC